MRREFYFHTRFLILIYKEGLPLLSRKATLIGSLVFIMMEVSVRQSFGDSEWLFRKQKAQLNFLLVVVTAAFQALLQQKSVETCVFLSWID